MVTWLIFLGVPNQMEDWDMGRVYSVETSIDELLDAGFYYGYDGFYLVIS